MTKQTCFALWGGLFALCAALGFIQEPAGFMKVLLIALAVDFFIPPAILLHKATKERDIPTLRLVRNLSVASLSLTVAALLGNFLSLMAPVAVGNVLYAMLVIISSPMVCGQYWILSLFGWACVLMVSLSKLRKFR